MWALPLSAKAASGRVAQKRRRKSKRAIMFWALITLASTASADSRAQPQQASLPWVEAVVTHYVTSLRTGDLVQLGALFGTQLRTERSRLLNDPRYSSFLASTFADANVEILDQRSLAPGEAVTTIEIRHSNAEWVRERLFLRGGEDGAAPSIVAIKPVP